jgi:hypothetical protein
VRCETISTFYIIFFCRICAPSTKNTRPLKYGSWRRKQNSCAAPTPEKRKVDEINICINCRSPISLSPSRRLVKPRNPVVALAINRTDGSNKMDAEWRVQNYCRWADTVITKPPTNVPTSPLFETNRTKQTVPYARS